MPSNSRYDDLNFSAIKQLLKKVRKNIDRKISNITLLQQYLEIEEQELREYFAEEKRLLGTLTRALHLK